MKLKSKTPSGRRVVFTADAKLKFTKFIRAAADPAPDPTQPEKIGTLSGYPIVWNVQSSDRGGFFVRLLPNSVKFTTPVLALWHHDASKPIGNTANGTLRLFTDDIGVRCEIDLPDTTTGRDAEELVENGYVRGMSFAFAAKPDAYTSTEGDNTIFNVRSVLVDEVTVTATPAFTQTSVSLIEDDEDDDGEFDDNDEADGGDFSRAESVRLERLKLDLLRP